MPKISIGIPCYDTMKVSTALSLAAALKTLDCELVLNAQKGPYMHWNRDACLANALDEDCSHLMFVDTDMVFPADGIGRLLELGKDIVGGLYNTKTVPPQATVKLADEDGVLLFGAVPIPQQPFQCWAVATGFMLINLDALAAAGLGDRDRWFIADKPIGEDFYFCRLAAEHGLEVWCDPTIPLQHLGDFAY